MCWLLSLTTSSSLTIQYFGKKLRVYVGKTENHLGTTSLFSSNFSRQTRRSEMIRGSTNINWVCEKRVSGRIDAVYDKRSICYTSLKLDRRNVRTSFLYYYEPSYDCTYVQK